MPSSAPICRASSWGLLKEELPDNISLYLPNGDPMDNKKEIITELNRLKILGPEGRKQMDKYVSGEINYETYLSNLNTICNQLDDKKMDEYRRLISHIEKSMKYNYLGFIPGFSVLNIDSDKCHNAVKNLKDINIYDNVTKKKVEKQTV